MQINRKKIIFGIFLWITVPILCFASEEPVVAVVKSRDIAPYNIALEGFNKVLKKKRVAVKLISYNLKGEREEDQKIIRGIKFINPDLILTLGSFATEIVCQQIRDIPVVFSMVLNPEASGFVKSMEASGNNLTGASMDISIRSQFEVLTSVIPNIKKIGIMYNTQENQVIIEKALTVAQKMGLELVAKAVDSEKEVPCVLEDLVTQIDALWSVGDSMIFTAQSTRFILFYTIRNSTPFMGLSPSFVKAGALLALTCDYEDIGRQSGEIALRILAGEKPTNISIAIPRKTLLSLNLRTAEQIGIELPSDIIEKAEEIFGK